MTLPATKLLDRLKVMRDFNATWPDFWRGFWDATRSLRPDLPATAALGIMTDKREYVNGYQSGEKAYKAARMHSITKPKKKP